MPNRASKVTASGSSSQVPSIPDGLVLAIGPDGERCLVAEYLVPATEQALAIQSKRTELGTRDEAGGVSDIYFSHQLVSGGTRPMLLSLPLPLPNIITTHCLDYY